MSSRPSFSFTTLPDLMVANVLAKWMSFVGLRHLVLYQSLVQVKVTSILCFLHLLFCVVAWPTSR